MSYRVKPTQPTPPARLVGRWAVLAFVSALGVAGCDPATTGLDGSADAMAAVQEVWSQLPSTLELESESFDTPTPASSEDAEAFVLFAADVAAEADVVRTLGTASDADALEVSADTLATRGILAVLGRSRAEALIRTVEGALSHIEQRLGSEADTEARTRLEQAADALRLAHDALDAGDVGSAVMHAGAAADALRWLDIEAKAKAVVTRAFALLTRAERLAGPDPDEPIARALRRAETLCASARAALGAGRWRLAITDGILCARISRAVIVRLGGGIDDDALELRAEEAVAHAEALFEKAVSEAGDVVDARVAALLSEAEALLERARIALEEDRFRAAIGLSIESSARSIRVLRILRRDDSSAAELRAKAAVETALVLSARVHELIEGGGAGQAIVDAVSRADGLVEQAQTALEAEAWRRAWWLARTAIAVYVRVILAIV